MSDVIWSELDEPVSVVIAVKTGAAGAEVSIVTANAGEWPDSSPDFVSVYVILWTPSARLEAVIASVAAAAHTWVPIEVLAAGLSEYRVIVFPASEQTTSKVGVLSEV